MLRLLSEGFGLFLLPFAAYILLLLAQRRFSFLRDAWSNGVLAWLLGSGLGLAIFGLLALGLLSERHKGAYTPAHIENGRLVPGHME
jgi:hypothetical protein